MKRRHVFIRGFHAERWHLAIWFKWWHGLANTKFEFEFRIGRPKPVPQPTWYILEDDRGWEEF